MSDTPSWAIVRPVKQQYPWSSNSEETALRANYPSYARQEEL